MCVGYDSVAHSPTSETPTTPSRCLIMASCDNEILNQGANEVRSPNEQVIFLIYNEHCE